MDAQLTGKKITERRKELSFTQKDISEQLHVSVSAVSKWERGLNFPDLSLIEPLSEVLEITVPELLGIENETPQKVIREITEISAIETQEYKKSTLIKTVCIGAAVIMTFVGLITLMKNSELSMSGDASLVLPTAAAGFFLACAWIFSFAGLIYGIKSDRKKCIKFFFCSIVSLALSYFGSAILNNLFMFINNPELFKGMVGFTVLSNLAIHAGPFFIMFISYMIIRKNK